MKIKTIDINAKEWFDKVNGNSYFSAIVTLNYGMKSEKEIKIPFQYGYEEKYIQEAAEILMKQNYVSIVYSLGLQLHCKRNNIILRVSKQENCLKRDVINFVN